MSKGSVWDTLSPKSAIKYIAGKIREATVGYDEQVIREQAKTASDQMGMGDGEPPSGFLPTTRPSMRRSLWLRYSIKAILKMIRMSKMEKKSIRRRALQGHWDEISRPRGVTTPRKSASWKKVERRLRRLELAPTPVSVGSLQSILG